MTNYKFDYAKKYHYMLKYFIMAFPLLFISFTCLFEYDSSYYGYITKFFENFSSLSLNVWYYNFISSLFGNDFINFTTNSFGSIIISYPLYILYLYVFDILLDIISVPVRLGHKFIERFGGDY